MKFFQPNFPFAPARSPVGYGLVIMLIGSVGAVLSVPGQTVGIGVFTDYLMETLQLDRTALSLTYLFGTIGSSLLLPWGGRLFDRFGARRMVFFVCLGFGAALSLTGSLDILSIEITQNFGGDGAYWALFALAIFTFLLLRQFGQGLLTMVSRTMVSKWFVRSRGLAIGISGVLVSLGFNAGPKVLNDMIDAWGWQTTCYVLSGGIGIGMTLLGWLLYRDNPEESGLQPDMFTRSPEKRGFLTRLSERVQPAGERIEHSVDTRTALRSYAFRVFNAGMGMQALLVTAVMFHLADIGAAGGLERSEVFALLVPMSLVSAPLVLLGGMLSDRMELKHLLMVQMLSLGGFVLSILLLDFLLGRVLFVVSAGVSGGLFSVLSSVTWPRFFGRAHLGGIAGFNMSTMVFCSAVGPALFALAESWADSYVPVTLASLVLPIAVLLAAIRADNPQEQLRAVE